MDHCFGSALTLNIVILLGHSLIHLQLPCCCLLNFLFIVSRNTLETQWIEYEEFAKMFMDEKITEHDVCTLILRVILLNSLE